MTLSLFFILYYLWNYKNLNAWFIDNINYMIPGKNNIDLKIPKFDNHRKMLAKIIT